MELTQMQAQMGLMSRRPAFSAACSALDWLYALALAAGALFALNRYGPYMDYYEKAILLLRRRPSPGSAGTGSRCAG